MLNQSGKPVRLSYLSTTAIASRLVVLTLFLVSPLLVVATDDLKPDGSPPACWQEDLVNSANPLVIPKVILPDALKTEHITGTMIKAKLCLDIKGHVVKVILLTSSGNSTIDDFYRACLKEYVYPPMEKNGRPCESIAYVLVHLVLR